jgi:hypothetical protein
VLAAISRRLAQSSYDPLLLQPSDVGYEHRFDAAVLIGVDDDDASVPTSPAPKRPSGSTSCSGRAAWASGPIMNGAAGARPPVRPRSSPDCTIVRRRMVAGSSAWAFRRECAALGPTRPTIWRRFRIRPAPRNVRAFFHDRDRDSRRRSDGARSLQAVRDAGLDDGTRVALASTTPAAAARASTVDDDPPAGRNSERCRRGRSS